MANNLVNLTMVETPVVRTDTLASLLVKKGPETSSEIIEKAVLELGDRLWRLDTAIKEGEMAKAGRLASSCVAISDQLGLASLAKVAQTLAGCLETGEATAIHAVAARLRRVGEWSLYVAVQFPQNAEG